MSAIPLRQHAPGQRTQVWIADATTKQCSMVLESHDVLLEAPNWTRDGEALILNGAGTLWRIPLARPHLEPVTIDGIPNINNDHVLDPDGEHIYLSANDWHLYRAPVAGGVASRVTKDRAADGLMHFLHGVSPDGAQLAFIGLRVDEHWTVLSAEVFTVAATGDDYRQLTHAGVPSDGAEFSSDGEWIYFNTEVFSAHSQIARMRVDGSGIERLNDTPTVDWFPHVAADGRRACYLAYPAGTSGHPADRWVNLMLVEDGDWPGATSVARVFGGQGTINVNSWAPDSSAFAFVAYPMAE